jgi:hypothetical protein
MATSNKPETSGIIACQPLFFLCCNPFIQILKIIVLNDLGFSLTGIAWLFTAKVVIFSASPAW